MLASCWLLSILRRPPSSGQGGVLQTEREKSRQALCIHTHKHIYPGTTAQGDSPPPEKPCKAVVSTHWVASPTASVELPLHFARLRNTSCFCGGRRVFMRPWHHRAHRFPLPAEEGVTGLFQVNQFASHHVTYTQSPPSLTTTSQIKQGIGT